MSMLAEPRRRTKWVLNHKNTHWVADTSKFGLRLMEKMGWTEGKGLGANEQGSTGHIQVKVRSDNRGVGFEDRHEDELVHQSEFSELLNQLASETPPLEGSGDDAKSSGIVSLEQKSQMSRSRVHYRKFTRGKDLSRYSEKDLASILGKPAPLISATDALSKNEQSETSFRSDVSTFTGGNMFDYFRKKKSNIGLKERAGDADTLEDICENNGSQEEDGTEDAIGKINVTKKKKKSMRAANDFEPSTLDSDLNALENTVVIADTRKDRKRKSKARDALQISGQDVDLKKINLEIENGLNRKQSNSGSEDCINKVGAVADGTETKKERKKRRKAEKASKISEEQTIVEDASYSEIVNKKHDKKSKQTLESAFDNNELNEKNNENALLQPVKEKKRRRKCENVLESSPDGTELELTTDSVGNAPAKKSKKNVNSSLEDGEEAESNDKQVERKQKHKKASGDKDNSAKHELEMVVECNSADLGSGERKRKKSKKSKKSKKDSDRSLCELTIQDNAESFAGIEKKKKKRRAEGDVNVIPDDGASDRKNQDGTIATGVHEPQFFCDARSKKTKKKQKLNETTEAPNDMIPAGSETPKDSCILLNKDNEFAVNEVVEIGSKIEKALKKKDSSLPENKVALKKPVSIVELNGNVYINGICNFELSHPVINNVELKRIPVHMRDDVEFLPIPGANVDKFGYIGLSYHTKGS